MNACGTGGWKNAQMDRGMIQDNSNKKMMLGCVKIRSQFNLNNTLGKKRKLSSNLTSGLISNVLVGFHTCLEPTFCPITPSSLVHHLLVVWTMAKEKLSVWTMANLKEKNVISSMVLTPVGTTFVLKIHAFFSHSVRYRVVSGKQKEGNNWTWNDSSFS